MIDDGFAVVGANININPDDLAVAQQCQHGGRENHRAATRNPRLDNDIGLGFPDNFLRHDNIGRHLYDGNAQP